MARGLKVQKEKECTCTIYVVKTKALISYMVTMQLIYAFVVAYAKSRISHDAAQFEDDVCQLCITIVVCTGLKCLSIYYAK